MLNFIRKMFSNAVQDIIVAFTLFHFALQIFYIAYLVYMICTPTPIWYLHVAMLVLSLVFLLYDYLSSKGIVAIKREKVEKSEKKARKERLRAAKRKKATVIRIKFFTSHAIKMFVLGSSVYPIIVAPETVSVFSIICTVSMVLLWIFLFWFEILKLAISKPKAVVMESLQSDAKAVTVRMGNAKDKVVNCKDTKMESIVNTVKSEKVMKTAEAGKEKIQNLSSQILKRIPKKGSKNADEVPMLSDSITTDDTDVVISNLDERIISTTDVVVNNATERKASASANVIIETSDEV